eukprot:gene31044-35361_t
MLEARLIHGDTALFDEMRRRFQAEIVALGAREFVAAKLAERDTRIARAGNSRYLVEPNVKESKGSLRDLNTLFWIAQYVYRVDTIEALVEAGLFNEREAQLFRRCEEFLWRVRCQLHYVTGRAEDRLSFDLQRTIEQHVKQVPVLNRFLNRFTRKRRRDVAGAADFIIETSRINVADEDVFVRDPVNLIRIFHLADRENVGFHPTALQLMTRSLKLITEEVRDDKEANRMFLEILTSKNEPETVLRHMNETGVLGRFVPEFGKVVAMMQFNMYHHYTVDEHLIRTLGEISAIEKGRRGPELPLATS